MNNPTDYAEFLQSKGHAIEAAGFEPGPLSEKLYPFQADIVRWALRRGRAAIFADCGMGKSFMQLEYARWIAKWTGGKVLIVAPLAVAEQTIAEGKKLEITVERYTGQTAPGIYITNYEQLHKVNPADFAGIVLDESSILKSLDGKTRTLLIQKFSSIPYRLCCTATPAPNDVAELANHAEFLGAMSRAEMLATFFVHDSEDVSWRLKGHAAADMWRWLARWGVFVRRPSDLGYPDGDWKLPALTVTDEVVKTDVDPAVLQGGIGGRSAVRRLTLAARVQRAAEIIRSTPGQWLVWCGLNDEGRELAKALGDDVLLVEGQDSEAFRAEGTRAWCAGEVRTMISKVEIHGFGMNFQNCAQVLFLGLGDSFEKFYQAVRRSWRHGQTRPVDVRIVVSDVEGVISENVKSKEREANAMAESIVAAVRENQTGAVRENREDVYAPKTFETDNFALMLGDCVERVKELPDASVGFSVFSPPFASLYTYSSSRRDMGNSKSFDEFFQHFRFLIPELKRVLMPGRRVAVHCQQLSTTKATHGFIGWRDFRGELIREFQKHFIYDGEICIDKNPQAQAIRTKSKQLMFVQKEKDSSWLRPAMADYVLLFRHPEENAETPVKTDVTNEEWILFAHPIWYGIRESNVLRSYRDAREDEDEKHICPLQLETIERAIRLWSNKGDVILSPFAGIGSEGYVALRHGRKFIGVELKESYWNIAKENLELAEREGPAQVTEAEGLAEIKAKRDAKSAA